MGIRAKREITESNNVKPCAHSNSSINFAKNWYRLSNKVTDVLQDNAWLGQRCFIVAGGESLEHLDLSCLGGEKTIAVNKSFLKLSPTVFYSMDARFYRWLQEGKICELEKKPVLEVWKKLSCPKLFLAPINNNVKFKKDVYFINRPEDRNMSTSFESGMWSGNNSGFGAIMLAKLLGVKTIYLLGFDMQCKTKSHWHKGYHSQSVKETRDKCAKFVAQLTEWAPKFEASGVKIVNLSPDSALTCFEFDTLENVLQREETT